MGVVFCILFIWIILSLKERTIRYQVERFSWALLVTILGTFGAYMHAKVSMTGGRWWYTFPFLTTAWNDSCAYFCGMTFGRHRLIGLSPNKSLEGFVGALFCNVLTTLYVSDLVLSGSQFWTCAPGRYTEPFEDYQCETLPRVYVT